MDSFIAALKDNDSGVWEALALALGKIGEWIAVDRLITAIMDKDSTVRRSATQALEAVAGPTVKRLIVALDDKNISIRRDAAVSLREIVEWRAVDPLIAALKNQDSAIREAAALALGKIGTPQALEAVSNYETKK